MISRRTLLLGAAGLAAGSSLTALSACAQIPEDYAGVQPLGQRTFADYVLETRAWIAGHRQFVTDDHAAEMSYNAPSETRPAEWPPKTGAVKGILLVHGLGDSPWSFVDQAKSYAEAGWLVRTVLLPGCGTRPEDMVRPTADDWRRVVREQAEILHRDLTSLNPGAEVWLGGFSTGCNLVTEFAYQHDWVEGLVLFSPAYAVRTRLAFLAPAASHVVTWLRKPEDSMMGGHTPFRYTIVPTQALAAFVDTMEVSRAALESRLFTKPVVVMMAEHDSVVDTEELLPVISRQMVNPRSRILWYGSTETAQKLAAGDTRVIVRTDVVPEYRVTSFSHMGMLYRPDNPKYGAAGSDRICRKEGEKASSRLCLEAPEDAVFYGAWGDKSAGTVRARLTFNPWYAAQEADIRSVMR